MKAQRRHELKENQLAKVIIEAPTFWQEWGGRFLAVAVAVMVVVVLFNYRVKSNRQAAADASASLATARSDIDELQQLGIASAYYPPQESATRRRQLFNDANNAIGDAIHRSDDHKLQAEALVARGDLFWAMLSLPEIPGAATQPALVVKDPKELLSSATEAYQTLINNFSDEKNAVIAARFGLAALDENKGDFDAAKKEYETLKAETTNLPSYARMVTLRLGQLDQIRQPVTFAAATTLPVIPPPPGAPGVPPLLQPPATTQAATGVSAATKAPTAPAVATAPIPAPPVAAAPPAPSAAATVPATKPR